VPRTCSAHPAAASDNVPQLNDANIGTEVSLRERLSSIGAIPTARRARLMDPLGFGLENYDAVGAYRTHDGKFPIESSGMLPGGESPDGSKG
jgi:hypothetical protein